MAINLQTKCAATLSAIMLVLTCHAGDRTGQLTAAQTGFARLVEAAGDAPAIQGKDDWLFLTSELRALTREAFWGDNAASIAADPYNAIVDLNDKLNGLGITLVLCPAARGAIYADKLLVSLSKTKGDTLPRLDGTLLDFYAELRAGGVTVIDVTDSFLEARKDDATQGPVCCRQDTHWSPRGIRIAATAVAGHIKSAGLVPSPPADTFTVHPQEALVYVGDLVDRIEDHPESRSRTTITRVTDDKAGRTPLTFDPTSPVILLADSHGLIFSVGDDMHCTAAGFGETLSAELGFTVDRMARRGSGDSIRIDLARRFLRKPEEAAGKKVLVYTFAARTLTESSNWKVVPLKR